MKWRMAAPPGLLCCLLVAVWWLAWSHCLPSQVLTGADSESRTVVEYWMDNWTVSDVTGHAGITGQYLANAIISDKSK